MLTLTKFFIFSLTNRKNIVNKLLTLTSSFVLESPSLLLVVLPHHAASEKTIISEFLNNF